MTPAALLADLVARGVRVERRDEALHVVAPRGVLTAADATPVPLPLSASDFFRLLENPMRHANSERPTSKITRLANTIHWLEKN